MRRGTRVTFIVIAAVVVMTVLGYLVYRDLFGTQQFDADFYASADTGGEEFGYESYAAVLDKHVDGAGLVDYAALKKQPEALHKFVRAMAAVDHETYRAWPQDAKSAFWINAYNALTLKVVIDNYGLDERRVETGLIPNPGYPRNSIRQISGVWDKIQFLVMGRKLTLNQVEHGILRGQNDELVERYGEFDEPRIHVVLVCAAMGCPELRGEPYVGEALDEQLDDEARQFLTNPAKFRIDRDAGTVYLSSIFEWFGEDFVSRHLPEAGFGDRSGAERAVLNFAAGYLADDDAAYLTSGDYTLEYLDYDWSLNQQQTGE